MKVKSVKTLLTIGLCVWGATGAAAFMLGMNYGKQAEAASDNSKGKLSVRDFFSRASDGKNQADAKNGAAPTLDSLLKTKGKLDPIALALWARGLSAKECSDAMAQLLKLPAGAQRDSMLAAVVDSWAKQNPKDYLANADKLTSPKTKEAGITAALQQLASQDPTAALAWLKDNPGAASTQAMQARYAAIITGYATTDPNAAFALVNGMPNASRLDANAQFSAFQALITGMASQGNFTSAVALLSQISNTTATGAQMQNQAMLNLVNQWAQSSPADAAAYVATLDNPQQQAQYDMSIAQVWAQSDPAAAAAWAAQTDADLLAANPNGQAGGGGGGGRGGRGNNILASTIGNWAQYDLDGPAQFLNQMPASPDKDTAVASFIGNAMLEDPQGAMGWVNTISNPNLQQRMSAEVAIQWSQQDPQGFQSYVNTLPAQQQQAMLAAAQNPGYGGRGGGFGGGGGGGGFGGGGGGGGFGGGGFGGGGAGGGGRRGRGGGGGGFGGGGGGGGGAAAGGG